LLRKKQASEAKKQEGVALAKQQAEMPALYFIAEGFLYRATPGLRLAQQRSKNALLH
jgi:hypothetical protein